MLAPAASKVRLNFNKKELRLELEDNGEGFSVADRHNGFGLIGMRERGEQMGGTLRVTSARGRDKGERGRPPRELDSLETSPHLGRLLRKKELGLVPRQY